MSINFYSKNCLKETSNKIRRKNAIKMSLVLSSDLYSISNDFHISPKYVALSALLFIIFCLVYFYGLSFNVNLFICVIKCWTIMTCLISAQNQFRLCEYSSLFVLFGASKTISHSKSRSYYNMLYIRIRTLWCVSFSILSVFRISVCVLGYGNRICLDATAYLSINVCIMEHTEIYSRK